MQRILESRVRVVGYFAAHRGEEGLQRQDGEHEPLEIRRTTARWQNLDTGADAKCGQRADHQVLPVCERMVNYEVS